MARVRAEEDIQKKKVKKIQLILYTEGEGPRILEGPILKPFSCTKSMMKGLCQLATTET
jgi:hypothetical protein